MKKIISIAFAAILAGLAISCQKEEFVSDKTDAVQYTFNITVNDRAGFDSDALTKSSESHKSYWEIGDRIFLFFKPTTDDNLLNTYATLTYDGSEWGVNAPGLSGLGEDGTLSAVYVYNLDSSVEPEFSDSKWTIATGNVFYNCQTGVDYTVSDNVISASLDLVAPTDFVRFYVEGATGALTCDKVKGWKDIAIGSDMAVSNVTCTGYMDGFTNSGDSNVKEYYGRIVDGTSLENKDCKFSVVKEGKVYERAATPSSDRKSFYMNISDGNWQEAVGKLPGLFTVGKGADGIAGTADDVQVRFSQGNLWYGKVNDEAEAATFNFEANQYDTTPASEGSWSADHISHFYWSKDASVAYAEGYNDGSASESDVFFTNETETTSKNSFTVNVGGTEQTGWRTLSNNEWQYLFNSRTDAASKVGYATVGGVHGIIILPDTFTDPMKNNNGNGAFVPKSSTDWTQNVYTSGDNWSAMESAGAVFLPAAGFREGSDVYYVGVYGEYWSSTAADDIDLARGMWFSSSVVSSGNFGSRNSVDSVRLITESK